MAEEVKVDQEPALEESDALDAPAEGESTEGKKKQKKQRDTSHKAMTRRMFTVGGVGAAALLVVGGLKYVGSTPVVRPPGGQDEDHLVSACIRCQRCYEVCPRNIIFPSHIENGIMGTRSPELSFEENYCDFCQEENDGVPLCEYNCPTGALTLSAGATPETTVIGLAQIETYQCLAYRDTACRRCSEACPYDAIDLNGTEEHPLPVVNADKCTGCGACEAACISLEAGSIVAGVTSRAITVHPLETIA